MNNFAGRWVFDQNETQSKVIDLSSDGNYVYEVRGATGGQGDVRRSAPGTYEITEEGNIRSVDRGPGEVWMVQQQLVAWREKVTWEITLQAPAQLGVVKE